jgi:hypothetical protein
MAVSRNTFVNFAFVDNKSSGAFKTNDYYLRPVERGTARNDGNRLVNSAAGFRTLPPNLDGQPLATVPERAEWRPDPDKLRVAVTWFAAAGDWEMAWKAASRLATATKNRQ